MVRGCERESRFEVGLSGVPVDYAAELDPLARILPGHPLEEVFAIKIPADPVVHDERVERQARGVRHGRLAQASIQADAIRGGDVDQLDVHGRAS